MLDLEAHENASLEFEGSLSHQKSLLDRLSSVELDISNALALATSDVSNYLDVTDLSY